MNASNGQQTQDPEVGSTLLQLLRSGLELGVGEASRKLQELTRSQNLPTSPQERERLLKSADVRALVEGVRADPSSVLHIVKEVWSRGGPKEKQTAADALGTAVARLVPHRALTVARDLAMMARTAKEADWVGARALGPLLEANPAMTDRVKQFIQENQVWIKRAALTGLIVLAQRRKQGAESAMALVLLLAESDEKEVRNGVRNAIRQITQLNSKASTKALLDWLRTNPSRERVQVALKALSANKGQALREAHRILSAGLLKLTVAPQVTNGRARRPTRKAPVVR